MDTFYAKVSFRGKQIGNFTVNKLADGVKAKFHTLDISSTLESINCGYFNWVQVCVKDPRPPIDINGKMVKPPYIDPFPNGYALQDEPKFYYWNDGLGFYWDMRAIATTGTGCYDISNTLGYNCDETTLRFEDHPYTKKGDRLEFHTWLVALSADFKIKEFLVGFSWSVYNNGEKTKTILKTTDKRSLVKEVPSLIPMNAE